MRRATTRRALALAILSGAALALPASASAGGVPQTITHQGRLYDASDHPINATLAVQFAMYADAATNTPLWSEMDMVTFDDGYFSLSIGQTTPFPAGLFNGAVLYMGITVGSDPEMTPRPPIQSVPYAMVAGDAIGDINPASVTVNGTTVIDATGKWVGPMAGLQGPQGPQGPQGLQGPQGQPGLIGPTGPLGLTGPAGTTGAQGPAGAQGAAGPAGAQGPAGPAGATGPAGAQGQQGAAGPAGAQGQQGAAGPAGATGAQGPIGPQGSGGPAGPAGNQGPQGVQGATGAQGLQGPAGATGPTGVQGLQGAAGPAGAAGAQGAQGVAGATGATGPAGAAGTAGAAGATGATGGSGIVATATIAGTIGQISANSNVFVFAGPTALVTTTAGQRVTGVVQGPFATTSGSAQVVYYDLCYQPQAGGSLTTFSGGNYSGGWVTPTRATLVGSASVVMGAGSWHVGLCVWNDTTIVLNNNDFATGWVQVHN